MNAQIAILVLFFLIPLNGCHGQEESAHRILRDAIVAEIQSATPSTDPTVARKHVRLIAEKVTKISSSIEMPVLRQAIRTEADRSVRLIYLNVLLNRNTNENIKFVLDLIGSSEVPARTLAAQLEQRLDCTGTKILLQGLAITRESIVRDAHFLQLICDVPSVHATAKSMLNDSELDGDALFALIMLLGNSSYYLSDPSTVAIIEELARSGTQGIQFACAIALSVIPGENADVLFERVSKDASLNAATITKLKAARTMRRNVVDAVAPGWVSRKERDECWRSR